MRQSPLFLLVNGEDLGEIKKSPSGKLEFHYSNYWNQHHPLRPLSRQFPVSSEIYRGEKVENYLKNLLPDSDPILSKLAAFHNLKTTDSFELLSVIGKDCVGAIQFFTDAERQKFTASHQIEKRAISETQIAHKIRNLSSHPLGQSEDEEFFRISLAGAQEKMALLRIGDEWFQPIGSTPTTHILKPSVELEFDGTKVPVEVENEWLSLKICELFGLKTAHATIEKFNGLKVLSVERFDRTWSSNREKLTRILQEDFCQAMGTPPHLKYESKGGPGIKSILEVLSEGAEPRADRYHFFKTQIVFWLMAAIDGHAKNFSIQWTNNGLSLTPLYDVLSADPILALGKMSGHRIALAMAVDGRSRHYRIKDIQKRHWEETAKRGRIPKNDLEKIFEEVLLSAKTLRQRLTPLLPSRFPAKISEPILDGIESRLKRLE